jgi:glycerol kinase
MVSDDSLSRRHQVTGRLSFLTPCRRHSCRLLYQLTGRKSPYDGAANVGGQFLTDVSNASRWLFLDIRKVEWDQGLINTVCAPHSVPLSALPAVRPSSEVYATLSAQCGIPGLDGVPVASILGDQQAALFGQCAFEPGEAKNTYGTGLFLMMNTGKRIVPSSHGLLTTIGYQIGDEVVYSLEGSVSHSGSTLQWLRDQLRLIEKFSDTESLATVHNDGLYFVPAFSGLFAPHWRSDARACIVGMTATHHRGHLCRAALEAAAYQTKEGVCIPCFG